MLIVNEERYDLLMVTYTMSLEVIKGNDSTSAMDTVTYTLGSTVVWGAACGVPLALLLRTLAVDAGTGSSHKDFCNVFYLLLLLMKYILYIIIIIIIIHYMELLFVPPSKGEAAWICSMVIVGEKYSF